MENWQENELKYVRLGDKRLVKRLSRLLSNFTEKPESSIPKACTSHSQIKAAYRFFDNENVESDKIRSGFFEATSERMKNHKTVLILSDATGFVFTNHKSLAGRGVLRNHAASGLIAHTCLAVTPEEEPLGNLFQKFWGRNPKEYGKRKNRHKKDIREKESYTWIEGFLQAQKYVNKKTHAIFVADRGADLYDLFLCDRPSNFDLLIRACHNRRLSGGKEKIFEYLSNEKIAGTHKVRVTTKTKRSKYITVSLRASSLTLNSPTHRPSLPKVSINALLAQEVDENLNPVKDGSCWKLLTTLPINDLDSVIRCVEYYKNRWLIERYHYVLKSGCKIEKLQLESALRINRAVAVYSIVAWRLMNVTYLARAMPNASCLLALEEDEWKALYCFTNKTKKPPAKVPSIQEAVITIAKLGGFLARKNDGMPGLKTTWIGLSRLADITESYRIWCKE